MTETSKLPDQLFDEGHSESVHPQDTSDDTPVSRSPQGYPVAPISMGISDSITNGTTDPSSPQKINRQMSYWNTASPFHRQFMMSPLLNGQNSARQLYSNMEGSAGYQDSYIGDWRSANPYSGTSSNRHSAAQYLNLSHMHQNSPLMDEPPGFPPIDHGEGSSNNRHDEFKFSDLPTPAMSMNGDQSSMAYWNAHPGVGTPTMISDWSDGGMTPWTSRPPLHPMTSAGFYPTPSPLNDGPMSTSHLHSFASPYGRSDTLFFYNKERHNDAPTDKPPTCPTPTQNVSENFSPWKNLQSIPDCKPIHPVRNDQGNREGSSFNDLGNDLTPNPTPGNYDENRMTPPSPSNIHEPGVHNSVGSSYHPHDCRPCAFYWTKGCINGADCRFCHEWHPPKKKKPMKEQKNLMIIARPDGKIEFMRCTVFEAMRVL